MSTMKLNNYHLDMFKMMQKYSPTYATCGIFLKILLTLIQIVLQGIKNPLIMYISMKNLMNIICHQHYETQQLSPHYCIFFKCYKNIV